MRLELLTIGTELLLGQTVDTNSAEIGRALAEAGIQVVRRTTVTDDPESIRSATMDVLERTGAVLTTGGLGPTADDITKKVIAALFDRPLVYHPEIWDWLVQRFARFGRVPSEKNRGQAEVPEGAIILANRWGTAPGIWLEGVAGLVIMLPGVPAEMRGLLRHEVIPRLAPRVGDRVVSSRTLRTTGLPESALAEAVGEVEGTIAPLSLAYLPSLAGVDLRVTAWGLPADEAARRLASALELLRGRAGRWIYGEDEVDLAEVVLGRARERKLSLATAESCTGGGVGRRLTAIPGSSEVYLGGVIAYDNRVKTEWLGVPSQLIAEQGAVSEAVARRMAEEVVSRLNADLGVAVTGVAGPAGGSEAKPVGLVCFAVSGGGGTTAWQQVFPGTREEVRARAEQAALSGLLTRILEAR
jgi:nicotinamide-nucleotide amidase